MTESDTATSEAEPADLVVRLDDGALRITLNRPQAANALTFDQRARLIELIEDASTDPAVRVVVIAANGRHFCGGMDLSGFTPPAGARERVPGDVMMSQFDGVQRLVSAVLDCFKPVVAVVQGPAAGIGLYLALACDLVVASEDGAFVETFIPRGMLLHCAGAYLLPSRMGMQRAKQFVLLGERLSAAEAMAAGLVNRVVPAEGLDAAVDELVQRLATGPTIAIGLSKRLLNRSIDSDRASAFTEEAMSMEMNTLTQDVVEGRKAFAERRPPNYGGH